MPISLRERLATMPLRSKGLLLIGIPLVIQMVTLCAISLVQLRSEQAMAEEVHARRISMQSVELVLLMYGFGEWLSAIDAMHPYHGTDCRIISHDMPQQFSHLDALLTSADDRRIGSRIAIHVSDAQQIFKAVREKGAIDQAKYQFFNTDAAPIVTSLEELRSEHDAIVGKWAPVEAKLRKVALAIIAGSTVFAVILAMMLVAFFNRTTRRRLKALQDDMQALVRGDQLGPPLTGNDEIADLDKSFKSMAVALKAAAQSERAAFMRAPEVVLSINAAGIITAVNPAAHDILGYRSEALKDQPASSLFCDWEPVLARLVKMHTDGLATGEFEESVLRSDGTLISTLWSVHWSDVEQTWYCVIHDVSSQKQDEAIKRAMIELVSQKFEAPIKEVLKCYERLRAGEFGQLSEHGLKQVGYAYETGGTILSLVGDLLDYEQLEAGKLQVDPQPTDCQRLLDSVLTATTGQASMRRIDLQIHAADSCTVNADQKRIMQVLVNLVSNALKFSPAKSIINISATREGDIVKFSVQDQGRGIPEAQLNLIFEKYRQVEAQDSYVKHGSGLGLTICKAIVEMHGGAIGVASTAGEGSTFWFTLPVMPKSTNDAQRSATAAATTTPDRK